MCWRLEVVLDALEMLEGMRRVLLCMLEVVEGELCLLEVLKVQDVMRCVLLCILEAVEGRLCLLEVLGVLETLGWMRRVRLGMLEAVEVSSVCWRRYAVCWSVCWRLWRVGSVC